MALGLYIHVPFCQSRCHFCSFYVRIHRADWANAYLTSLQLEIQLHGAKRTLDRRAVDTVYFGGGTPTTLTSTQLVQVLEWIRTAFELAPDPEISIEAHPDTITLEGLHRLAQAGFTRVSLGLQSADRHELIRLGRLTEERPGQGLVALARTAGFKSVNLDLMYGLPGQSFDRWMSNVDEVLACRPDHVSCYALTIEEHSHLHVDLKRGTLPPLDLAFQNELEDAAAARLAEVGFERYEISNYAQPGHSCRHNLLYWQGEDYLGLGPSAQSYVNGVRFGNISDLESYSANLAAGNLPLEDSVALTGEQRRREALVFGLRLTRGVPYQLIEPETLDVQWAAQFAHLVREGLLVRETGRIRLTPEGRRMADSVAVALL